MSWQRGRVLVIVTGLVLTALLAPGEATAAKRWSNGVATATRSDLGWWQTRLTGRLELAHGGWEGVATLRYHESDGSPAALEGEGWDGARLRGQCSIWPSGNRFYHGPRFVCDAKAGGGPLTRFHLTMRLEPAPGGYAGVFRQKIPEPPS